MTKISGLIYIVINAVILQTLLFVSQLTADSIDQSAENYVVDISSPDVHVSYMKRVSICISIVFAV